MTTADTVTAGELELAVVVSAYDKVAEDVVRLTLRPADGSQLPSWTPGAHLDLLVDGEGTGTLVRQYSLCGDPKDPDCYQVSVLKTADSRGGSLAVHQLAEGDAIRVRGPRNHFALESAVRYVFIAGGIGITPLLPMIEEVDAARRDWELHYCGRSSRSMAFVDELAKYGDRVHVAPTDEVGRLDLDAILASPADQTLVYCCGPEPLLQAVEARCADDPAITLHTERFAPKEIADDVEDTAFEVVLQRTGKTLRVEPGVTVFDTMRAAGVNVLGSCLEGICGTCEQGVLEGEVDHRDSILEKDEQEANDCMMVCVSRARSARLVLDA